MTEADSAAARLTPQKLFEMMAGFKATAVLRAGVELGVFDALAKGPADAAEVAARLGTDPRGTRLLLGALAALGLLQGRDDWYELAAGAEDLLVSSSPQYCGGITAVASSQGEWEALGQLARTVREGTPVPGVDALAPDFPYWSDFATHTTFGTLRAAGLLADVLDSWARPREDLDVLDVGCGHGLSGYVLAQRLPQARVHSQDWPTVLEVAGRHAERLGVRDRVEMLPGDAFEVPLTRSYDLIVVGNVLFHFPPDRAAALVRRLAGALAPDGRLVVMGFTTGDQPPAEEPHAHLLGLLMLSWTRGGEMHSTAAHRGMLAGAGLTETELHARPGLPLRILVASRPRPTA
ncbi:class I SAM-dependent methyltransferase [Streptomyces sp. TG1A-8]|uniref:class I SAM-dependent methyltransferase n=1 Tax=Streptomyces sp. TG1A-8 TaxID=3051385 RepID=UPI00265C86B6|nr:class I SAM-dependent methyltransferase [Streptomyces sp. TG1A-8]MDO0926682.1 class I SAM-dependent methyltransferase [Streptomyces sp. TG1A-8]